MKTDTYDYILPRGAEESDVIRAVTGTVGGGMIQDFDIHWFWLFEESDAQDIIDTWLGDKAAFTEADDITIGLFIVVEDYNSYIPNVPDPTDKTDPSDKADPSDETPPTDETDPSDETDPTDKPDDSDDSDDSVPGQVLPEPPPTGDTGIGIYVVLMCISGAVLILLIADKIRTDKCEK